MSSLAVNVELFCSLVYPLAASNDDGKFLLAARKCRRATCTDYIISLNCDDVSKGSSTYIGKLRCVRFGCDLISFSYLVYRSQLSHLSLFCDRSNFLGTKFTVYDSQTPNSETKVVKSRSTRLVNMKQVSPRAPAGNYPAAHISYELNVLGSR